ncbi:MAG: GNAT family N-acetyltransferase [Pseudomonadota bacterium]
MSRRIRSGSRIDVVITYLEQREKPAYARPIEPPGKIAILKAENPPLHFYRYLYRTIGDPYKWVSRRSIADADLAEIIHDDRVALYVLYADGCPAGMAEIDFRDEGEAEIKFFGLMPERVGKGYGAYFFSNILDIAWTPRPERVKLETCTLDHPSALRFYQKHGFSVYDRQRGVVVVSEEEAAA